MQHSRVTLRPPVPRGGRGSARLLPHSEDDVTGPGGRTMGQKQVKRLKHEEKDGGAAVIKGVASSAKASFDDKISNNNKPRPARQMSATAERLARVSAFGILASHAPRGPDGLPIPDPQQAAIHSRLMADMINWMYEPVVGSIPSTVQPLPIPSPPLRHDNESALPGRSEAPHVRVARRLGVTTDEEEGDDDDDEEE